jgi:glutamine amidotransferase
MNKVSIIDYGMGNLLSMQRGLEKIGAQVSIASSPEKILQADRLVLPGVGAFPDGMAELEKRNMIEAIQEYVKTGKILLGVCLGMQMLFKESEEIQPTPGLGFINGRVIKLPEMREDGIPNKVPHVAWSPIAPAQKTWEHTFLHFFNPGAYMYFVHSYFALPDQPSSILAQSSFGNFQFCSAAIHENVWGTQFHPEKSGENGLKILNNLIRK